MAIISKLTVSPNDTEILPITPTVTVYHNNGNMSNMLGNGATNTTNSIYECDDTLSQLHTNLAKIDELSKTVSAKSSSPDDIVSALSSYSSTIDIGNNEHYLQVDNCAFKYDNFLLTTIDVASMTEANRSRLGELLGIEVTADTKLYASYLYE